MSHVLIALTLLVTIFASLSMGVVLGYGLLAMVLRAMGRRPQRPAAAPAVLAGEAHGGD